ncbi:MAG: hypothetical protein ACD_12C00133G0002 [uncultured bacterium]|nr:MAG: hypothetical protein ACD_12C00133G0002 [uncultured bacterium]
MKYRPTVIYPTSTAEGRNNLNVFGFSVGLLGFSQTGALAMFPRQVKYPKSIGLNDSSVVGS